LDGRYGGYQYYNPSALRGSTSASEVYAEIGIPLLKDLPLVKALSLDIAGRETHYSISGNQDTWKLGLQWAMDSNVMLRTTASQDVRSPDVLELFNSGSTKVSFDLFPNSSASPQTRVSAVNATVGNPNLGPEIAHTFTAGMVFTPSWASGLQTSLDYYKIKIDHAIESLISQGVVDGCSTGDQFYCRLITVNGTPITSISQITAATTNLVVTGPTENVAVENTSGVDLNAVYTHSAGPGEFTSRVLGNYLIHENLPTAITGCARTALEGAIGGCLGQNGYPRWKANFSLQYDMSRFGVFVQERFIGGGKADPWNIEGVTITRNKVPMITYTDLTVSYSIGSVFNAPISTYLNVTNLFNRDPPTTVTTGGAYDSITSVDVYDTLGRRFVLGFKTSF
ncbi:MAG TPA: TonB-dependent receptor, partial [Steroidobacteraceae bacterium]